jgi:hypothetical protein
MTTVQITTAAPTDPHTDDFLPHDDGTTKMIMLGIGGCCLVS